MGCNAVNVVLRPFDIGPPPFYDVTLQINCRGKSTDPAIIEYGDGGPRCSDGPVRLALLKAEAIASDRVDQM